MFRLFKFLLVAAITLIFMAFAVANRETAHLSLFPLPYTVDMPLFLLAVACLTLGVCLATLVMLADTLRHRREAFRLRRRVMALENEIAGMKMEQGGSTLPAATQTAA